MIASVINTKTSYAASTDAPHNVDNVTVTDWGGSPSPPKSIY